MFTWRVRNPLEVSCVKLPAAVAFPTDDRLLQRLEESRRALPPNSVKALIGKHAAECSGKQRALPAQDDDAPPEWGARPLAAEIQKFPPQWTLPKTVHIEDVYARSRIAIARR